MRYHENHEKKLLKKKAENKEDEGIKFINQYKYLGLNLQNSDRLIVHIDFSR
jgi:hypothetical protein